MWNFLKHFLIPRFHYEIRFGGRPALQERITPTETNCWREDCLIFSTKYLEKRSQTLVGKSMNSSLTFETFRPMQVNAGEFTLAILFCLDQLLRDSEPIRLLETPRSLSEYILNKVILSYPILSYPILS